MTEYRTDLATEHLAYLAAEGTPANTVSGRARVLRSLAGFLRYGIAPEQATREDVEAWWAARRKLAPATRANDLAHLRAFYRWAQIWEHRPDDPTLRISAPKTTAGLPRPMSRDDLLAVLRHLDAAGDRNLRRAVCLGAYAGLRVSEAASLAWGDVDIEARRARVLGKGGKTRLVALSALLIDELLPVRNHAFPVVVGDPAREWPYTPAQLQRRVNRAIAAAGVDGTFHQLRHRYGTLAYQATGDVLAVGRQMGHASPVTTAIYAAASDTVADLIAEAVAR